jgi:hypothetical protein
VTAPTIALTTAAAARLGQIANTPGLLTSPDDLYRVGAFNEDHLSEIPHAPEAPLQTAPKADREAWEAALKAWAKAEFPLITTTEKRIDAIKALLKSAAEKGALGGTAPDRLLLAVFRLAPQD